MATVNEAKLLMRGSELGLIEEEFLADLMVLKNNALDDICVPDKPEENFLMVVKSGRANCSRWTKSAVEFQPSLKHLE